MFSIDTYDPLNVPKAVGDEIWIIDGPVIGFQYLGMKLPFPTRMTIIRLASEKLFIHSPIRLTAELKASVDALGEVACLIAPNTIHYAGVPEWQAAYPAAQSFCAPGVIKRAKSVDMTVSFDAELADTAEPEWADEIKQLMVRGGYLSEAVFYHPKSRTLVLTDLIENFEAHKIKSPIWRWLVRMFGSMDPDGCAPRDMRMTFAGHKESLRKAVDQMIDWAPERVIMAHGRWYDHNGTAEIKRAFRWAMR
ncbi:DUF4336 domain-containing protein [Thalassospira xiamenensis]|uniref:DUF4336 domain-containing protein n=1 Tax=Thalassospira xiamenensis TaxID=220697 RepID=UPI003AA893DB